MRSGASSVAMVSPSSALTARGSPRSPPAGGRTARRAPPRTRPRRSGSWLPSARDGTPGCTHLRSCYHAAPRPGRSRRAASAARGPASAGPCRRPGRSRHHERSVTTVSTSTRPRLDRGTPDHPRQEGRQPAPRGHRPRRRLRPRPRVASPSSSTPMSSDLLRRHAGRNAMLDLKVGQRQAPPRSSSSTSSEHPVTRRPIHVDLFVVKLTEEITVDIARRLHGRVGGRPARTAARCCTNARRSACARSRTRCRPPSRWTSRPSVDFEATIHVSDIVVPDGVTILTDADRAAREGPAAARGRGAGRRRRGARGARRDRGGTCRGGVASPAPHERRIARPGRPGDPVPRAIGAIRAAWRARRGSG